MYTGTIAQMHDIEVIDDIHILVDDDIAVKFVEREKFQHCIVGTLCRFCFFRGYACGRIPCTPTERNDCKEGLWVVDYEYKDLLKERR